jgi:hypothetical protein
VLSNTIKQKRKEKAGKWEVPLPKVRDREACCILFGSCLTMIKHPDEDW